MRRIASAQEALEKAAKLSAEFDAEASLRDAERRLPHDQVQALKDSGLLALTVPTRYGGIAVPNTVLAEVFRLIAHADPSLAQIPHSHFVFLEALRLQGNDSQKVYFYDRVRNGALLANAQSERGPHPIDVDTTTLVRTHTGDYVLSGRKFYSTGALFADWVLVRASLTDGSEAPTSSTPKAVAFVPRDAAGLTVHDDWDGMGQRTTASGAVRLRNVVVHGSRIMPYHLTFDGPQTYGAFAQLLHAAIDTGIARAALANAAGFVTTKSRPYPDAGVERAADDPLVVHAFGQLEVQVRAAEALLAEAGLAVEHADRHLTAETAAEASLAVAAARAVSTQASLDAGTRLFEVCGTRSALASLVLDRHWRNARTHTLHDPASWKVQHLGRYAIEGTLPPNHGQL
jgi:SfnB family sulfur acquisition oxidoreductase